MSDDYSLHCVMMAGGPAKIEAENGKILGLHGNTFWPWRENVFAHSLVDWMIWLSKPRGRIILQVIEHCGGNP
jgi:hypothetical protein